MAKTLEVYLHERLCGYLIQDAHGQMRFKYAESWLEDAMAVPLSHSLPLRKERFTRRECEGFFGGILPEQDKRRAIARILGISPGNDVAMLEQIGGECAGAVIFMSAGAKLPDHDFRYDELTRSQLANILKELPKRPLLAGQNGIRLSLAGAQDKIAVQISQGRYFLPLGGAPSTHILKPAIERFKGSVFNEALCMKLAAAAGLHVAPVDTGSAEGIDYLVVERYDRRTTRPSPWLNPLTARIHQEDFCQATAISPDNKYEREGGPGLKKCFDLVRAISSAPAIDLQRLLDAVIFNFLVGNNDAHGKNFSFTRERGTVLTGPDVRFAPLYDVLSTSFYPELSQEMAMTIGGEYKSDKIRPKHFDRLAEETGLAKPLVKQRIPELAQVVLSKIPEVTPKEPVALEITEFIRARCQRKLQDFLG